jgi:hypothetical protein
MLANGRGVVVLFVVNEAGRFRGQKLLTLKDAGEQWDAIARIVKVVRRK